MKKKLAVLTLLLTLNACAVSGCGSGSKEDTAGTQTTAATVSQETTAADTQETTVSATEDTDSTTESTSEETNGETPAENGLELYKDVLDKYRTAIAEKWDYGTCMENDICALITNTDTGAASFDNVGAALIDMDHDGYNELIIGDPTDTTGKSVYEIWTFDGNTTKKLISAQERRLLNVGYMVSYMQDVNVYFISAMGSNSAAEFEYDYYTVSNGALQNIQSVISEAVSDTEVTWYQADSDSGSRNELDADTANGIVDSYSQTWILPDYVSLASE
ncbi:hypothetical protein KQI72_11090 [Eubacterium sp. MSJ-21]|nr:hypothetical protein [Eubacterium sp. MSJ-21]